MRWRSMADSYHNGASLFLWASIHWFIKTIVCSAWADEMQLSGGESFRRCQFHSIAIAFQPAHEPTGENSVYGIQKRRGNRLGVDVISYNYISCFFWNWFSPENPFTYAILRGRRGANLKPSCLHGCQFVELIHQKSAGHRSPSHLPPEHFKFQLGQKRPIVKEIWFSSLILLN